jgi:predicted alpha/beta superfamily hydrolase
VTAPYTPPLLPGQKTSAIYALDSGYGVAGPSGWLLGGAGAMQPAYIVTIGYPPEQQITRDWDLLARDATRPSEGTVAKGGGAAAFTAFLLEELKPFIEGKYPVDPARGVLFGHSLAGIYAANVLADHPDAFAGYLIASPSLWADPTVIERLKAAGRAGQAARVYVAYGADEAPWMVEGGEAVARALAGSAFQVRKQAFPAETHISYYPAILPAAGPFLLPRSIPLTQPNPVALSVEQLAAYEGTYRLADGRLIRISRDGARLFGEMQGAPRTELSAEAPARFFIRGMDFQAVFDGAPAQRLTLHVNGDSASAVRVN